jgi:hypothetical protein
LTKKEEDTLPLMLFVKIFVSLKRWPGFEMEPIHLGADEIRFESHWFLWQEFDILVIDI